MTLEEMSQKDLAENAKLSTGNGPMMGLSATDNEVCIEECVIARTSSPAPLPRTPGRQRRPQDHREERAPLPRTGALQNTTEKLLSAVNGGCACWDARYFRATSLQPMT